MRRTIFAIIFCLLAVNFMPTRASAAVGPYLKSLYESRADLRALFDEKTYLSKPEVNTVYAGLEDWARQSGWREDKVLEFYKPKAVIPVPVKSDAAPKVSASSYVVIDKASGLIIAEKDAGTVLRLASLTKLMTVDLVLSKNVPLTRSQAITADDNVGGSRLGVAVGTKFSVNDLLYAALLPSANDAANALADATKLTRAKFVAAMNERAKSLGLTRTVFTDPTGIDDGNMSTPREFALLAANVFENSLVRNYSTTAKRTLTKLPSGKKITVKNSDHLLTKTQYDDVLLTGGKTGFIGADGGWNLVAGLKPAKGPRHELLLVLFGGPTLAQTEEDTAALAKWAWVHYQWK